MASSLPPGAAMPAAFPHPSSNPPSPGRPPLDHQPNSQASQASTAFQSVQSYPNDADSPPGTPRQKLLGVPSDHSLSRDNSRAESPHVQYATYPEEKKTWMTTPPVKDDGELKPWVPYPLRPWFWITFVIVLVAAAIGLEVALHFSKKNNGWKTNSSITTDSNVLHYVYTLPPVAVAAIVTAMWTWTDFEIKKMQPYVDLVHGDSPPHRSLLLDYTRSNNFFVWTRATRNKHYLVALASLMVVLSLAFQPLAAALLDVRSTWWELPPMDLANLKHLGLNQNQEFSDLTGYASASVLYDIPSPPFVMNQYTVAPFQIPTDIQVNGTVLYANTTAMKFDPGCQPLKVNMTQTGVGEWLNSISFGSCSLTWQVEREADFLFGTNATVCNPQQPPQFSPIAFWFFNYVPTAQASATICQPTFELFDVNIQFDLASQNVTSVREIRPFTSSSNFSSAAGNITGEPLNGRAYNGIEFNLTEPVDPFVAARRQALQIQMAASVFQQARESPAGLSASFDQNVFVGLSTKVYLNYLTLMASTVYFVSPPSTELNTVQARTVMDRVFLSDTAVHLLATAMLLLAFFSIIIQFFHRQDRRSLKLRHEPGTIASAVSIGGQTEMGALLARVDAGKSDDKEIVKVLGEKRFRIDPQTMKIVMEGEDGYEFARSPGFRRSVFNIGGRGGDGVSGSRLSRRFSAWGGRGGAGESEGENRLPKSPKSPLNPGTPRNPERSPGNVV
ncbi:hypothetical protein D9758_009570 [Tetrapyrgos nigripes]|uniref:Uncharacterized protein n=1 Tax=Tetrapyrgos nigripes TaxID=182062 RepID=A0A8H5GDB3_9AGAR|nr:hypothetical protein D9758_009570 [Tetrapyrgos nigripes]